MKRGEAAALSRLVDEFGAEILVSIRDHHPFDRGELASTRYRADEYVTQCRACGVCSDHSPPVSATWPGGLITKRARVAVVGDMLSHEDRRAGRVFTGRAGSTLRNALASVGLPPEECAYLCVLSGYPHVDDVQRAPTATELTSCSRNLEALIVAADVRYVLLFGAIALRGWRSDVTLTQAAGNLYVMNGKRFVWPMWHPNAVLRGSFDGRTWRGQLAQFAQIVADDAGLSALGTTCLECTRPVDTYDPDGMPWCREHLGAHYMAAVKPRKSKTETISLDLGDTMKAGTR